MSNPPWRRRRQSPRRRGNSPRADSRPPGQVEPSRPPIARGANSPISGSSPAVGTSGQGAGTRQRQPRGTGAFPVAGRRPQSTYGATATQVLQPKNRGTRLAALTAIGVIAIATGWILLGGGSSTNPSAKTGQATQPQGTSVTRAVASTTSTTAQVSKPQVVASLDTVIRSIVEIAADCPEGQWGGSGTIVLDGTYVLTNHHVAPDNQCEYVVCFTESWTEEPSCDAYGEWVAADIENDLAVLELIAPDGGVYKASGEPVLITGASTSINEEIFLVGYPGVGGSTITSVRGVVSGLLTIPPGTGELQGEFIKTDARSGPGVSGGAAFNSAGEYIGTPTGGRVNIEEGTSLGFIRPGRFARTLLESLDEG